MTNIVISGSIYEYEQFSLSFDLRMSLTIDEVLERIGGHGRFQTLLFLSMTYLYMAMAAFHLMVIAFIAGEPYWECVGNSTTCNFTEAVSTVSKRYKERCSMPRSEWKFTDTYTSTVTEVRIS